MQKLLIRLVHSPAGDFGVVAYPVDLGLSICSGYAGLMG